ncbi:helix-turn-helix domain-containing protein [Acinetobacter venetianus]|uniref:helix-turn-helix domain-containing protein n=1 Tax=Acinetobacter venetianus TaxID=52133 RepID=UPI00215029D0|nr:helix-turn-helix domain-containing protein [Acinetobacter venetianus]MCR4532493.1 helix-turn-helix domain-containing protein [Acinetobacter venetianus]
MKIVDKQAEIDRFNAADNEEEFSPESLEAILGVSKSWLQKMRCVGGGIPFSKVHYRKIIYKKSDVLAYIERKRVQSTSQMAG